MRIKDPIGDIRDLFDPYFVNKGGLLSAINIHKPLIFKEDIKILFVKQVSSLLLSIEPLGSYACDDCKLKNIVSDKWAHFVEHRQKVSIFSRNPFLFLKSTLLKQAV